MGGVAGVGIALRPAHCAIDGVFQPGITDKCEIGLLHGQINVLTLAGSVPMQQRQRDGTESTEPGDRVRVHLTGIHGMFAVIAQQCRHARRGFYGAADAGHVGPGAHRAVGGQACHDQVRADAGQRVVVYSQISHHPGREILGHEVGVLHQVPEQRNARGL